jgi:hypothetical protein
MTAALVLTMAVAAAATPTLTLVGTYNATSWGMYALQLSQGDNDGLTFCCFKVGNVASAFDYSPSSTSYVGNSTSSIAGIYGFSQNTKGQLNGVYEFVLGCSPVYFGTQYGLKHINQQTVTYTFTDRDGGTHGASIPSSAAATLTVPTNTAGIAPGNYPYSFKLAGGALTNGAVPSLVPYGGGQLSAANALQVGQNSSMAISSSIAFIPAPEPATLALLAAGGAATLWRSRRRK